MPTATRSIYKTVNIYATGPRGNTGTDLSRTSPGERSSREIFRLHYNKIYRYAYFKLGSVEDAEDVAATVFLEMVRRLADFEVREGASLSSWLFRIAHNLVVNKIRGRTREEKNLHKLLPGDMRPVDDCEKVVEALDQEELLAALRCLTEAQRSVLIMRFANEMSIKEVSEVLGKPESAVKALQRRALVTLKRKMANSCAKSALLEMAEAGEGR